jgi:arylsulfatase A-like enzyme
LLEIVCQWLSLVVKREIARGIDGPSTCSTANKTDDPEGFYSTRHYTKRMIQFLEDRSETDKKKPFFGYLTYTAPHWPLQAPRRVIDK